MSLVPPALLAVMIRTGLFGYGCASAGPALKTVATIVMSKKNRDFITFPLRPLHSDRSPRRHGKSVTM